MGLLARQRWFFGAAGITLVFAGVCLTAHTPSPALTAFSDLAGLALMLVAMGICTCNALSRSGPERSFWAMIDVSRRVARVLGFERSGTARVKVEVLHT